MLAPYPQRRLAVDQPVGHRLRKELLLPSVDSRLHGECGLNVGQILLDGAQALVLGLRNRHGVSHGSLSVGTAAAGGVQDLEAVAGS